MHGADSGSGRASRRVALDDETAAALFARIREGDEHAFREIYLAYFRALWEFAYSLVGSGDVAEDIVQEVFAKLWSRRAAVTIQTAVDAYLYASVRHGALNARRFESVRARERIGAAARETRAGLGAAQPSADERVMARDLAGALTIAVRGLPPSRRTALMLRVRHGLDYARIGEAMGISPEAAMIHVSRARTSLRAALEEYGEAGAPKDAGGNSSLDK